MANNGGLGFTMSPEDFYRRFFSQQQITTGRPSRAEEVSALISSINQANQSYELPRQQLAQQNSQFQQGLAQQNSQFQQNLAMQRSMQPSPSQAWISGIGNIGNLGMGVSAMSKEGLLPWGKNAGGTVASSVAPAISQQAVQQGLITGGLTGQTGTAAELASMSAGEAGAWGYGGATAGASGIGSVFFPSAGAGAIGGMLGSAGGQYLGNALGIGGSKERSIGGGILGGAVAGGAIGGPVGAIVGGVVGGVSSAFGGDSDCIIVTCCEGRDSEEVNITREFRDKFLDTQSLRGYYRIAEPVVEQMNEDPLFKLWVKREIVDHLIEYGKRELGYTDRCGLDAESVSLAFLDACKRAGEGLESYTRKNGEVI